MRYIIKRGGIPGSHDYTIQYEDRKAIYCFASVGWAASGQMELTDTSGRRIFTIGKSRESKHDTFVIIDTEDDVIARLSAGDARISGILKIDSDYGVFLFKGDLAAANYAIFQESEEIARLEKKHPASSDTYILDIYDYDTEELLAMAAGAENLGFDNSDEEDFFDAFLMAAVVITAMLFQP